jgi:tetratricopeptide (TPR) repeat protein
MSIVSRRALPALLALAATLSCAGEKPARETRAVEQVITHRVEAGETWRTLARDFYGSESRAAALARDNGGDASVEPPAGSAVRVPLDERDARRIRERLDAARVYNEGLDLASAGSYAAASEKFEEAVRLDPAFNDAYFNLAVSFRKLGLLGKEATILRELVAIAPESVEYRYALGASLFDTGDLAGAEKAFREVLAASGSDRKALFSLAVVLEKRGKAEEAASRFREYLAVEPDGEWADAARSHLEALSRPGGVR